MGGSKLNAPIISIRDPAAIEQAAACMRSGQLVIVPTDTIYGLATALTGETAVQHLYDVRGRKQEPALPFLIADLETLPDLARPNAAALRLARRFWPGLVTLILPPSAHLPAYARARPVAVRIPDFPALLPLIAGLRGHMLITGAIRSGYPPAITAQEAAGLFDEGVAMILDGGPSPYGIPSTIVDCVADPPVIVRRGMVPESKIWAALDMEEPTSTTGAC